MNKFEAELKHGRFVISECPKCKIIVWPPSSHCNICFEDVIWRNSISAGKLIEFSKKDNTYFGLAEFEEKIRIIGTIKTEKYEPKTGQKVKIESCSKKDGNYIFVFSLI
jgi:uncharacterized protein